VTPCHEDRGGLRSQGPRDTLSGLSTHTCMEGEMRWHHGWCPSMLFPHSWEAPIHLFLNAVLSGRWLAHKFVFVGCHIMNKGQRDYDCLTCHLPGAMLD
jgi:hypothetical protein